MGANDHHWQVKYMIIGFFPDPLKEQLVFSYTTTQIKWRTWTLIRSENIVRKTIIATLPQMKISYINPNMIHGF